ncbi:MAG: hypothetical protein JNK67_09080 [Alphaproteobacteria bacterium]|nr:hypothetical protein [Alphaproteobacteria bacterium]
MRRNVLAVHDPVVAAHGQRALDGVSFDVEAGLRSLRADFRFVPRPPLATEVCRIEQTALRGAGARATACHYRGARAGLVGGGPDVAVGSARHDALRAITASTSGT